MPASLRPGEGTGVLGGSGIVMKPDPYEKIESEQAVGGCVPRKPQAEAPSVECNPFDFRSSSSSRIQKGLRRYILYAHGRNGLWRVKWN